MKREFNRKILLRPLFHLILSLFTASTQERTSCNVYMRTHDVISLSKFCGLLYKPN